MSTELKATARYSFTVPAKYDPDGTELAPAKTYPIRRLSLREREDQYGSIFESLQIVAGQYVNEGSQYRLEILHRDLLRALRPLVKPDFLAEVEQWIHHRGGGPLTVALTALIMTEEGIITPEADADPETTLPSESDIDDMAPEALEKLGENSPEMCQTISTSPCASRAETSLDGVESTESTLQPT